MNVLSLFDGMSCGQIALERAGIEVDNYFASEIDKSAIQVTQENYPNTKQVGNITELNASNLPKIDLLIGGSPCQGFSRSGKALNFEDPRSKLFFEYIRLLKDTKPKYFFLENVVMKKEWIDIISKELNVNPLLIDSHLVSGQKRQRLYWTNIPKVELPLDLNIKLSEIINPDGDWFESDLIWFEDGEYRAKNATKKGYLVIENGDSINLDFPNSKTRRGRVAKNKSNTLNTGCNQAYFLNGKVKRFTPIECERLQTVSDNYTSCVSDHQRYKMLGNGWTVDVIAHFFLNIKDK